MKIIQVLPELDIGGVERHVIDLSNELAERGHDVLVISNGGQMQGQLYDKVLHWQLPVHKKDPFTAFSCSKKIFSRVKDEGWEVIHAHSRVPAWIAWIVSYKTKVPWLYTAHACYSLNYGLIPLKHAKYVISVSETVKKHLNDYLPPNNIVVQNALPAPSLCWSPESSCGKTEIKFLFIGRLTRIKGLQTVIEALGAVDEECWTLDVLGDGIMMDELKKLSQEMGISQKVTFHGSSDETDEYMAKSDCLLFPSYSEGMPLTLARAVQIGIPVIASNIPSVSELAGSEEGLVPPGDIEGWRSAITYFMSSGIIKTWIPVQNIPTFKKMVDSVELVYFDLINKTGKKDKDYRINEQK